MDHLPRLIPPTSIHLPLEPLTPTSFSPFGTVITSPLPPTTTTISSTTPTTSLHLTHQPPPQPANQNTALKTSPISPLTNNYPPPTSSPGSPPSTGQMSIFSCFPRTNTYTHAATGRPTLKIDIIERHPYTTQTFCPFNYSHPSPPPRPSSSSQSPDTGRLDDKTYYLVIVAPTLSSSTPSTTTQPVTNPPDLSRLRAFYAAVPSSPSSSITTTSSSMAITYNPATWHAPMIVLGSRRVDFLVTQFVNGVPGDDCQEVRIGSPLGSASGGEETDGGKSRSRVVEVDLSVLDIHGGSSGWSAKL